MRFGEIIILNFRSGGTLNTKNIKSFGNETGETEGGIFRSLILKIGWFVSFINNDETKIFNRGKKSGTRTNNNFWSG